MTHKQDLVDFLAGKNIKDISLLDDMEDAKYGHILQICQSLEGPLLNSDNLQHLILIAKSQPMGDGYCPRLGVLSNWMKCLVVQSTLTQDTFIAFCNLIKENSPEEIGAVLSVCFKAMKEKGLLKPENIEDLLNKIKTVPKDSQTDYARKIYLFLHNRWINKKYFDLLIQTRLDINVVDTCIKSILNDYPEDIHTIANCQALIDCFPFSQDASKYASFDARLKSGYDLKFDLLLNLSKGNPVVGKNCNFTMKPVANKEIIQKNLANIHRKLLDIKDQPEHLADPRKVLHLLAVILNALPTLGHEPQSADITELLALGREAQGRPSPVWQAIGISILLLGAAIAFACLGVGVVAAVVGLGLFAYGSRRTGLSKDILSLAAEVSPS